MRSLLLAYSMVLLSTACGSSDPAADAAPAAPDARIISEVDASVPDAGSPDASTPPMGECRAQADCAASFDICYGPNEPMCGAVPLKECDSDASCGGNGRVCHSTPSTCSVDGIGSMCGFACIGTGGPACPPDFACDSTGHCRPAPCGDGGFTCAISEHCDPTSIDPSAPAHAITHGCVVEACTMDATCPATTRCVNGRCQDGFGTCSPPVP